MVVRRKSKSAHYRGSKTHGCGSMKKRRGAGNRGGRGNAGTGKRSNTNEPTMWKNGEALGKFGFKKKGRVIGRLSISIRTLEVNLDRFVKKGIATKDKDVFTVNIEAAGFDKLVSTGAATKKMIIDVPQASAKAIEKIKTAGGEVRITE